MNHHTRIVSSLVLALAALPIAPTQLLAQASQSAVTYLVTVDKTQNGTLTITPSLPADGKVAAGTVLNLVAKPATGFALDSGYYTTPGPWGRAYHEFPETQFRVTVDQNKSVGASFIEEKSVAGYNTIQNVVYAQPGAKQLKYDVYRPNGAKNLPCIVIIHGGGWTSNDEDVMRGLARELVRPGRYVVISTDYRWLGTKDGDKTPNSMANLLEDVYGAIAHVQEHAADYGVDPTRIAVTGDSAGGHLSAAAINFVDQIGDEGFGVKEGVYQFKPTYLPKGKTSAQVRQELLKAIKVAAPSYGVFGGTMLGGGGRRGTQSEGALRAVAPLDHIPSLKDRAVPQLLLRGTADGLIQDAAVQAYADALKALGQRVEYVQVSGAGHAFFDWKPEDGVKATFEKYGVPYAARMQAFFDSVIYAK